MATTRSPLFVLSALVLAAFVPLAVMWVAVAGWSGIGYLLGFALYFLVFHLVIPARVYVHARDNGSNAVLAWTALAFVLPVLGAAVYFLVGMAFDRVEPTA
ncbi:PLDc N-terminal domain-containing protein [Halogeometricum limi]|uniref:Phospholipase_D-nuclease N-terminal n=1 Tax=Halogeometricum limi TaxID=555875 RepID=A0A1I6FTL9_9EURY|nr:PLDc N-terminal domain-containing protein [Halogeometricum limi]SFR33256.1 Phospholipase_D-nuclease N-terminal [Halogeometricum limi]